VKRRDLPRVERRRPLVEMSLTGDSRQGPRVGRLGCASLLSRIVVAAIVLGLVAGRLLG
jgi:hypothetical protein